MVTCLHLLAEVPIRVQHGGLYTRYPIVARARPSASREQRYLAYNMGGGYNSAFDIRCIPLFAYFNGFFGNLKFLGDIQVFADFSSFNDFENLWVFSGFIENLLKRFKTRINN